jgi:DNA-binding PadR family transcriptional regulator
VRKRHKVNLTTPDLVVLGLLAERPMHGYDVVLELERREVQDWAGVSRPQVYYSLQKLAAAKLIAPVRDEGSARGPKRTVFGPTTAARAALADSLERHEWATQRPPPPFLTWTALSIHARRPAVHKLIDRRRSFLREQIARETTTLGAIRRDEGPLIPIAESIVGLAIRQFELELAWLDELETAVDRRHCSLERHRTV